FYVFRAPPPPALYTLSLHDALPISTRAPTRRISSRLRQRLEENSDALDARYFFVPARSDRRANSRADRVLPAEGLGGLDRVHGRSAPAKHLLGDVRQPDVRPEGRRRHPQRDQRVPRDFSEPLH